MKKTDSRGSVLREAQHINRSLTFLEQVVIALSSKGRDHVPFRSSKLTHVLRDSLGGNCVTRLIANIWPEKSQLEETISTLKFATRMMRLTNDATVNIDLDPNLLVKKYEQQIVQLKQELAMHDTLSNRSPVSYDPYTPEQQYELATAIRKYVRGDINKLEVISLQQVHEMFNQFRNIVLRLEEDAKNDRNGGSKAAAPAASPVPDSSSNNSESSLPVSTIAHSEHQRVSRPPPDDQQRRRRQRWSRALQRRTTSSVNWTKAAEASALEATLPPAPDRVCLKSTKRRRLELQAQYVLPFPPSMIIFGRGPDLRLRMRLEASALKRMLSSSCSETPMASRNTKNTRPNASFSRVNDEL